MFIDLPERQDSFVSGSQFLKDNINTNYIKRSNLVRDEILKGNIPAFWREFCPVTVSYGKYSITYQVSPDFILLGSDDDWVRTPMNAVVAQEIADTFNCSLPTVKMVNDIWKASNIKLTPEPRGKPYDASMFETSTYIQYNEKIKKQLDKFGPQLFGTLYDGHCKNLVLTNKLIVNGQHNPNERVAIYGWIYPSGSVIQGLNPTSHELLYEDYSHAVRLIYNTVTINDNKEITLQEAFQDPNYGKLLNDTINENGLLKFLRY